MTTSWPTGLTMRTYFVVGLHVDRILRGAKAVELPVQVPAKFDMILNLETAKALGLTCRQRCSRADGDRVKPKRLRRRLRLVYALLATTLALAGCEGARLTRDTPADRAQQCRQMQDKLASDQTLTPTQTAEITRNMVQTECGNKFPGR